MEEIALPNTGHTEVIFDVFVSDPVVVDQFIYRCWLRGYDELEASNQKLASTPSQLNLYYKNLQQLMLSEVQDQYRNFRLVEHHLRHPSQSGSDAIFQVPPQTHQMMIESYYEVDDVLMRELIGRKLTGGLRRDMQDISEKVNIKIACCYRQFENLKRVYKTVIRDLRSLSVDIIQSNFGMSRDLACKYSRIVFMCFHRFDIAKKRLHFLTYPDFDRFAAILMTHWGDPAMANSIEVDLKLKDDIRDLKAYLFSSKDIPDQYRRSVKAKFSTANPPMSKVKLKHLESKFKSLLKVIMNIGANMSDWKQFKDVFEDMVEKIGDVCLKIDLTAKELDLYFQYLEETFEANILSPLNLRHGQRFAGNWRRYLEGLRGVMAHIYPRM